MLRAEAGSRPACESLSFASPKERNQRKGDPAVRVPPLRYGQPAMLGQGVRRRTHCALRAPFKQLRQVSARSACVLRHTHPPPALRFSARTEGNPGSGHPSGPSLRSAPFRGRKRHALRRPGRAQRWPVWMSAFRVPFCARREAQGRGCVRVPKDTRTSCTDSPQLCKRSAAGAQRVLRWHPLHEHRRLPRSAAKGTRAVGSPSLW